MAFASLSSSLRDGSYRLGLGQLQSLTSPRGARRPGCMFTEWPGGQGEGLASSLSSVPQSVAFTHVSLRSQRLGSKTGSSVHLLGSLEGHPKQPRLPWLPEGHDKNTHLVRPFSLARVRQAVSQECGSRARGIPKHSGFQGSLRCLPM